MPAYLTINGHTVEASPEVSLFDLAERAGIRVPTSCIKNGKCKECLVEITDGVALLSARTPQEEHLGGAFRLSCQAHIAVTEGDVQAHTMRRSQMRIERHALGLPTTGAPIPLEPSVTRD